MPRSRAECEFCFASGRRVNVAFMKAHRKVPHKSPRQKISSKGAQPLTLCAVCESSAGLQERRRERSGNPVSSLAFERDFCSHTHNFKCLIACRNRKYSESAKANQIQEFMRKKIKLRQNLL